MTISEIAEALANSGLQFTSREIEDILWLASRISVRSSETKRDTAIEDIEPVEFSGDLDEDLEDDAKENSDVAPEEVSQTHERERQDSPLSLFAGGVKGNIAGSTVRVKGVRQPPDPVALRRALHPLARRVDSRILTRLDELETARKTAETGICFPVFVPVQERYFDLVFIIEECTSSDVRSDTLKYLSNQFRHLGSLREVKCFRLRGDSVATLASLDGDVEYGLEHLRTSTPGDGRSLLLFATDGTSARWRNGSAQAFIHAAGAFSSISLLHLLPRDTWRRTLIGEPDVTIYCEHPGALNEHLQTHLPWWMDIDDAAGSLPVPVLSLDAASTATWARAISARGGATMQGVLINRPQVPIPAVVPPADQTRDPVSVVARYRSMASPIAYQLAVFLSATDPQTVQIMRLIQRTMLPDSGEGELAEFLLGGLVTRMHVDGAQRERLYRFHDGVKDELRKSLRYSEDEKIRRQLRLVGAALDSQSDAPRDLEATFPAPSGTSSLSDWSLPFAEISSHLLQGFGRGETPLSEVDTNPDEGTVQNVRTSLRILHFSDLQIRDGSESHRTGPFGAEWGRNLSSIAAIAPIDLICVSGDVTWSASRTEFSAASEFLDATLASIGCVRKNIFVVPGNHDIRRTSSSIFAEGGASFDRRNPALRAPLNDAEASALRIAEAGYREWVKDYLPHQYVVMGDQGYGDFQTSVPGWVVPIQVVGIDSAWVNAHVPGATHSQMQTEILKGHTKNGVTLAIMHHPPQDFPVPSEVQARLSRMGVDLLLHSGPRRRERTTVAGSKQKMFSSGVTLSAQDKGRQAFHVIDIELDSTGMTSLPKIMAYEWNVSEQRWEALPSNVWNQTVLSNSTVAEDETTWREIFIGRDDELNRLTEILSPGVFGNAGAGRVVISGPIAVGKTALALKFADRTWSPGTEAKTNYIRFSVRFDEDIEGRLLSLFESHHIKEVAAKVRDGNTLLILDDVDTEVQTNEAIRIAHALPMCPILIAGRGSFSRSALPRGWEIITLDELPDSEVVELLLWRLLNEKSDLTEADARAIVGAVDGVPAILRLIINAMADGSSSADLLRWLGVSNSNDQQIKASWKVEKEFPEILPEMSNIFERRWHNKIDRVELNMMSNLAYGPVAGFSTSLGLALSGFGRGTASSASIHRFENTCAHAVNLGILQRNKDHWRFAVPSITSWLRSRSPKLRNSVIRRWSDWIAVRLAASPRSRDKLWREVNTLPRALIEWTEVCSTKDAEVIRPVFLPYAIATRQSDVWMKFCERIQRSYAADDNAGADWYFALAQLALADERYDYALETVERFLALKKGPGPSNKRTRASIDAGTKLRVQILARRGGPFRLPIRSRHDFVDRIYSNDFLSELRPYQMHLANVAVKATIDSFSTEKKCIGLVIQPIGSGMFGTLCHYLLILRNSNRTRWTNIVVVADRIAQVKQLLHALHDRTPGFVGMEPRSVAELRIMLQRENAIVVTTEQKLRQLEGELSAATIVVGFGLRHSSLDLVRAMPNAKVIFFGNESLTFNNSKGGEFGPTIAAYTRESAILDGHLYPSKIRLVKFHPELNESPRPWGRGTLGENEFSLRAISSEVQKSWRKHAKHSHKAMVIVESEQAAQRLAEHMSERTMSSDILVLTASVEFKQEVLDDFLESTRSIMVTTVAMFAALPLSAIDVCYIACPLTPDRQLRIDALVSRWWGKREVGEIIDFANNDWSILGGGSKQG